MTDKILTAYPFIKQLDVSFTKKITDINWMSNSLRILRARGNCGINNKSIKKLNLIELDVGYNNKITDVNHMCNSLRILDARSCSGISDKGIMHLNLTRLYS